MSTYSQLFPPAPSFTERSLGDLSGKVFLITGAAGGVGLELAKILYSRNGTVYVAARSVERANVGIKAIREAHLTSKGRLAPLAIDLADMHTVKPAAERFLAQEDHLNLLVHNAGVMVPPAGSKSISGHDLELCTNNLGPFLLTKLLEGVLEKTAMSSPKDSVRVVWVASMMNRFAIPGGVQFDKSGDPKQHKGMENYMQSKAGDVFLASQFAKELGRKGVLSVSVHPGLMLTELQRNLPSIGRVLMGALFKPAQYGAYTELFAGLSPDVTGQDNGAFFIPWGRRGVLPEHVGKGIKSSTEGGTGAAKRFYDWCERETMPHS